MLHLINDPIDVLICIDTFIDMYLIHLWEGQAGRMRRGSCSVHESSRNVRSWDRETVGALGSGLKGRQAQEMWWWVFAGVCLVKKRHFQTASHPHALVLVRGSNLPWMG